MRAALVTVALLALAAPTLAQAHPVRTHRHAHVGWTRPYHIPRFSEGRAEEFVHTAYPYRTGLYVPWPDALGAPYPY